MSEERPQYQCQALVKVDDMKSLGSVLARSGYFQDAREEAQAVVKVLAGQELGLGPIASMTGIYIVKGRVTLSANLIGAAIKRSGRYDYQVVKLDNTGCVLRFYEKDGTGKRELIGESTFGDADAKQAGLGGDNWTKFRRNMHFARAMSNGAKWYCPDVFAGPIYTPDELGARVDGETGEIIDGEIVAPPPEPTPQPAPVPDPSPTPPPAPQAQANGDTLAPDVLLATIRKFEAMYADKHGDAPIDTQTSGRIAGALNRLVGEPDRHALLKAIAGTESTKELRKCTGLAILKWLGLADKSGYEAQRPQAQAEARALLATVQQPEPEVTA